MQQFQIIKDLCELPLFQNNDKAKDLKVKLYTRYGNLATEKIAKTELIIKTRHWLERHPEALEQYNNALAKFEGGIFERNTLDDMRLAFELLVKDLLSNGKSLENNISELGNKLKDANTSVELRNMCTQIIKYYTDSQNNHVKHNDKVNENEIEYTLLFQQKYLHTFQRRQFILSGIESFKVYGDHTEVCKQPCDAVEWFHHWAPPAFA